MHSACRYGEPELINHPTRADLSPVTDGWLFEPLRPHDPDTCDVPDCWTFACTARRSAA